MRIDICSIDIGMLIAHSPTYWLGFSLRIWTSTSIFTWCTTYNQKSWNIPSMRAIRGRYLGEKGALFTRKWHWKISKKEILWHRLNTFRRSSEVTDLHSRDVFLAMQWLNWWFGRQMGGLVAVGVWVCGWAWSSEAEYVVYFLDRFVYRSSRPLSMSIKATDPVCRQATFLLRAVFFPSGILCATNIRTRYRNNK